MNRLVSEARRTLVRAAQVGSWPIRAYFVVLVMLFMAVAAVGTEYVRTQADRDARRTAQTDAGFAAATAAKQLEGYLVATRASVNQLAANPEITQAFAHPKGCSLSFSGIGGTDRGHLDIIRADGSVACSSRAHTSVAALGSYRAQRWLKKALTHSLFLAPVRDRASGAQVAITAMPIPGAKGVIAAFTDLTAIGPSLASLYGGGRPVEFLITTGDGRTVISRSIDPKRWLGASLGATQFPAHSRGGYFSDLDNTSRFYATAPVSGAGWRFYAGEDASAALKDGATLAKGQLAIIAGGLIVFLLTTWFAYRNLVRPIRRLRESLRASSAAAHPTHVPAVGPMEVVGVAEDINNLITAVDRELTKRQTVEEKARASERNYRLLFENNPNPMWVFELDTLRFLAVNDAAVLTYGYSAEEFLGMTIEDIRPERELTKLHAVVGPGGADRSKLNLAGIWRHRRKDRAIIDVEVTSHAHDFEGRAARVVLAVDVSERLRGETALQESEARYRELFQNATDLIATTDLDGHITNANSAFTTSLGYALDELIGRQIMELVPTEWHDDLRRARDEKRHADDEATIYEHELVAKDGHCIRVEVASRLVKSDGRPVGVEAICRDISERKLLEERLRQSQRLEAVGQLAGGIAHDFNNLLTVISGYTEVLQTRSNGTSTELEQIGGAAQRAADLTRQLLAFSRRQVLQPQVIDLNEIVSGLSPMLTRLIGEHVELVTSLQPDLAPVLADPGQLEQVLMNLVINARDAMPNGGELTIETGVTTLDESYADSHADVTGGLYAVLAVSDTGEGMSTETLKRVFEPFFTTKAPGDGTGLGLATVHGIVKQSGGNIWVYSELGHGTTFKIYLPVVEAEVTSRRVAARDSTLGGDETILVVEDQDSVRSVVTLMLERNGYTVYTAACPADALGLVEQDETHFDLLLTDLVMPQLGGRELAAQINKLRPALRVLFMSGYADHAATRSDKIDQSANYLEKPFSESQLTHHVRNALDDRTARRADATAASNS